MSEALRNGSMMAAEFRNGAQGKPEKADTNGSRPLQASGKRGNGSKK